ERRRAQRRQRPRRDPSGAFRTPARRGPARAAEAAEEVGLGAGQDAAVRVQASARRSRRRAPRGGRLIAVASVAEIGEGKEICICAGSGGVGKTTTSAAIAAGLAAQGKRV